MNNVEFLNGLAKTLSAEFNERIPVATKSNMEEIAELLNQYPTTRNEFISALTNKVAKSVIDKRAYQNRYKWLHKGKLPYGTSIEIVVADIVKGKDFSENFGGADNEIGSLLAKEKPDVKVQYIERNIQLKYKLTVSTIQLMGAFTTPNGLSELVNALVTSVVNSMELDEEILVHKAIQKVDSPVATIKGYDAMEDDKKVKMLTKVIRTHVDKMQFMSTDYNKVEGGFHTFARPKDLVIFVTPETKAEINVDLLASVYHMEKAEIGERMILVKEFDDEKTLCKIMDENVIQLYENMNTTGSFDNGDRLEHHTFYHRWLTLGICPFFCSLEIKKGDA